MLFLFKCSAFNIHFNNLVKPLLEIMPYAPLPKIIINTLKTHSGTKKRWSSLPSGKFKRKKAGKTHLNSGKNSTRLNRLGKTAYADKGKKGPQTRHLRHLLPFN
ncbi:hypothetical protein PORY_000714 [Pneumocystis oryctolagi]|uniref:Uncharacterized protein n=1 Tax=Pneumocystis oryctolagi TaxID=42067 RepID=A0ACB7CFW4_9ASCO|nr:hypothetical protein PORY_000714 [Pneumocystis oryctolagi]